jgi:hypothetical protein
MRHHFYETKDAAPAQFCCCDCGASYVLTSDQQQWFHAKGYPFPKRCEVCRAAKRERNARREANG